MILGYVPHYGISRIPKEGIARETTTTRPNHSRSLDISPPRPHKRFFSIYTAPDLKVGQDPPDRIPTSHEYCSKHSLICILQRTSAYDIERPTMTPLQNLSFSKQTSLLQELMRYSYCRHSFGTGRDFRL